ncbi:MAG: hypothetical protein NZ700_03130 [Gemmataceae bacterium]|nr:hypothetical protein [Gemmataceae bacterium]MDW8265923.1 hypothetical protein [Gemmataceae bacterium]
MDEQGHPETEEAMAGELKHMVSEPLLPVEKALIAVSLLLGLGLLGLLLWVSRTFFPAP